MFALSITPLYAGLLALLYVGLSFFVIRQRFRYRVSLGDGGREPLQRAIRVHGNFAEFVPLGLVLLLINELAGSPVWALHGLGAALLVGRVSHAWGLLVNGGPTIGRGCGMVLTFLALVCGGVLCLSHFV